MPREDILSGTGRWFPDRDYLIWDGLSRLFAKDYKDVMLALSDAHDEMAELHQSGTPDGSRELLVKRLCG